MRRFFLALRFLTVFPLGSDPEVTAQDLAGSTAYYPLVGLILGLVLYLFQQFGQHVWPAYLTAALTVALWLLLTAGLHLDGLMDMFDGLGVRGDRERRLAVMRDSRVGAFGAQAAILLLLLKTAAVWAVIQDGGYGVVLLLAPIAGRTAMVALMATCGYARQGEGLGRVFTEMTGKRHLAAALVIFALAGVAAAALAFLPLFLGLAAIFIVWRLFVLKNFGGITGDIIGATCEMHELAALLLAPLLLL
jgi:adenosylcobinamide-GDP ribazoletransferase